MNSLSIGKFSIIFLGTAIAFNACVSGKKMPKIDSNQSIIKSKFPAQIDTIVENIYDTMLPLKGFNWYKKDEKMVDALKPFFVENICYPGNTTDPLFKNTVVNAERLKTVVGNQIMNGINDISDDTYKYAPGHYDNLKRNVTDKNYKLEFLMRYSLAPDVVMYDGRLNLRNYYHLDTTVTWYILIVNNNFSDIFFYDDKNGRCRFKPYSSVCDSVTYTNLQNQQKKPVIALQNDITYNNGISKMGIGFDDFGYVEKDYLILSKCFYSEQITMPAKISSFIKEYKTQVAEYYHLGIPTENYGKPYLYQKIESFHKYILWEKERKK